MPADTRCPFALKLSFSLLLASMLGLQGCGGGGEDDSSGSNGSTGTTSAVTTTKSASGTVTESPAEGMASFETEQTEILPGVFASRSEALVAIDPANEALGFRGLSVQKIENTTNAAVEVEFTESIPKTFAEHVDDLRYKVIAGPNDLTIDELLADSSGFVSIDQLVSQGTARVIEEDPWVLIAVGVAINTAAYIFFERPDVVGLTPRSEPGELFFAGNDTRADFVNEQLLDAHCDKVVASARANNIPPRLLANTILNEIADYGWEDTLQEIVYTGRNRSHGQVQLQPGRILDHGLIDVGPAGSLRNPAVDLDEAELEFDLPGNPGEPSVRVRKSVDEEIYHRLLTPEGGIELAARELDFLLKMLEPGQPALNNPWAQSLLKDPSAGIDRDDIYGNLKVARQSSDAEQQQIELERSLAVLLIAAYNGSGAIFNETDETRIFTDLERSRGVNFPWENPSDIDDTVTDANGNEVNKYPLRDPRVHADNGGTIFPTVLHQAPCLDTDGTFTAQVSINGGSSTYVPDTLAAFETPWVGSQTTISIATAEGSDANAEFLSITINPNVVTGPGTYSIGSDLNASAAIVTYGTPSIRHANIGEDSDGTNAALSAISGSLILTEFGQNTGDIVAGSFAVSLFGGQITGRDDEDNITSTSHTGSADGAFDIPVIEAQQTD